MITFTKAPITLNDVADLAKVPFLIEGSGALKINFESEANKQKYLGTEIHGSLNSGNLNRIFNEMADNLNTGSIN